MLSEEMKISEIVQRNEIEVELVKEALNIKSVADETKTLKDLGIAQKDAGEGIAK